MIDVNVTTLRQNLPQWLALVARGERLRITSRGKVVAELTPPEANANDSDVRASLLGSVLRYDDPLAPVLGNDEWDMMR